jgi:hypothetical protein
VVSGNSYGWDSSGFWPSILSAYNKMLVGWVQVIDITYSQTINVLPSCDSDVVYRIRNRMQSDTDGGEEYFLLEGRGACGYDKQLQHDNKDRQGIAIWYVDHTNLLGQEADGTDVVRYDTMKAPGDDGWPMVHGIVNLLPADGNFDMEHNTNRGDEFDLFRKDPAAPNVAFQINNMGVRMNDGSVRQYPNTKSIATGTELWTGTYIEVLDNVQYSMRVKIVLRDTDGNVITEDTTPSPTSPPTPSPVSPTASTDPGKPPAKAPADATETETEYTCDNLGTVDFSVIGVGPKPEWSMIRNCHFIDSAANQDEYCELRDISTASAMVYEKCQRECFDITGCPPPTP